MLFRFSLVLCLLLFSAAPVSAGQDSNANNRTLEVYNWLDYIGSSTLAAFAKTTGIRVTYHTYESNEVFDALLSARTPMDVGVPTANPYFARQIAAGLYLPLDKTKIPHAAGLDPQLMRQVTGADPGNRFGVIYSWGTNGIGYNVEAVRQRLPGAPTGSWNLVFKPEIAKNFADCGISFVDSGSEIVPLILHYLGLDPNSQDAGDLQQARNHLYKLKPYIKQFHSGDYWEQLAKGEVCIVVGYSGDIMQARVMAKELKKPYAIDYALPAEGSMIWFDMLAIPAHAAQPEAAHAFINYLLEPKIAAAFSNERGFANAIPASWPLIDKELAQDPDIFPPESVRERLWAAKPSTERYQKALMDMWAKLTDKAAARPRAMPKSIQ